MGKMVHRSIIDMVKDELEVNPAARNSDDVLYSRIAIRIADINKNTSLLDFLRNRNKLNVSPYETVSRTRRKLQHRNPELRGSDDVAAARALKEEYFRRWASE